MSATTVHVIPRRVHDRLTFTVVSDFCARPLAKFSLPVVVVTVPLAKWMPTPPAPEKWLK